MIDKPTAENQKCDPVNDMASFLKCDPDVWPACLLAKMGSAWLRRAVAAEKIVDPLKATVRAYALEEVRLRGLLARIIKATELGDKEKACQIIEKLAVQGIAFGEPPFGDAK